MWSPITIVQYHIPLDCIITNGVSSGRHELWFPQFCSMPALIYEIHRLALVHDPRKLVYTSLSLLTDCTLNYILWAFGLMKVASLFYYLAYFYYYSWALLHFLILFMSSTVLFQLTFTSIYSTFNKNFSVLAK